MALAAPQLISVFPGRLTGPDGTIIHNKTRIVLTAGEDRLLVAYAYVGRQVETIVAVRYSDAHPERGVWQVTTNDGIYQIGAGQGCGCSSPLKSMPSPPPIFVNVEPWDL